jgi:cell division septum initiation protein DivIVA
MSNIDEILEQMDELLDKSATFPFASHKVLIDGERLRDLINDIRLNIPQEIKRAKLIDFDCERIIREAEQKAEQIVQRSEERAKALVANDAIVKEAKQKAIEMLTQAQTRSKEIRGATNEYVDSLLNNAEKFFTNTLNDVNRTKQEINKVKKK